MALLDRDRLLPALREGGVDLLIDLAIGDVGYVYNKILGCAGDTWDGARDGQGDGKLSDPRHELDSPVFESDHS
jgi:hypothetical protein